MRRTSPSRGSAESVYSETIPHPDRFRILDHFRFASSTAECFRARFDAGDYSSSTGPNLAVVMLSAPEVGGEFDFGAGAFKTRVNADEFALIPPFVDDKIIVDREHRVCCFSIRYEAFRTLLGPDAALPADGDFGELHRCVNRNADVPAILHRFWSEARMQTPVSALFAESGLLRLGATLLSMRSHRPQPEIGGLAPRQCRRIVDYIQDRLATPLRLVELSAVAGLSPFHFARAFKVSLGLSPHAYVTRERLRRAASLLVESNITVTEIALAVGYPSSQSLARAFLRAYRTTPSDYRRRLGM